MKASQNCMHHLTPLISVQWMQGWQVKRKFVKQNGLITPILTSYVPYICNTISSLKNVTHAGDSKFQVPKMSGGQVGDFFEGLGSRIGFCSLEFEKTMKAEHCYKYGATKIFTSSNYNFSTCSRQGIRFSFQYSLWFSLLSK